MDKKERKKIPRKVSTSQQEESASNMPQNAGKTIKSLSELPAIVELGTMNWEQAEKAALGGELIRCKIWDKGCFLWYRKPYTKIVGEKKGFYKPCTKAFLDSVGVKELVISGHWCRYREGKITVGFNVSMNHKAEEWEIYKQEIS